MSFERRAASHRDAPGSGSSSAAGIPGKRTLTEQLAAPTSGPRKAAGASVKAPAERDMNPSEALALGMRGEERPLPHRAELARKHGCPLDDVRCFFGGVARQACEQMQAEAFTVGNVIVFGTEAPSPELVAHELAHVTQQGGGAPGGAITSAPASLAVSEVSDARERDAEARAHGGEGEPVPPSTGLVLSRYFATAQRVALFEDRQGQSIRTLLDVGTRVAKIYDPEDLQDGWVEVRVTHKGPLEATGFLREGQLAEHPDEETVDLQKAYQLHRELAQGSFDTVDGGRQKIPFGYSARGCQARAQAMAQLLAEKGYRSQKIFAVAERDVPAQQNKGALTGQTLLGEPTRWPFHVAPILRVIVDHQEWLLVIDPALHMNGPMVISEWMKAIGAPRFTQQELGTVQEKLAQHDLNQVNTPDEEKTLLPPGGQPFWFRAPSNVYDFMTLAPQSTQEQGESRFLVEGAGELTRHNDIMRVKYEVIEAIRTGNVQTTLVALGKLASPERLRLRSSEGFLRQLQVHLGQHLQTVYNALI